jgi:serine/threonine protein kinase
MSTFQRYVMQSKSKFVLAPDSSEDSDKVFTVRERYVPKVVIGSGAFGVVVSAFDEMTKGNVAIKKIHKYAICPSEAKRMVREVKILKHVHHANLLSLKDAFTVKGDLYLVTELLSADLYGVIKHKENRTEELIASVGFQILCGLKHLHSCGVVHRDLKPSNIFANADCTVKIGDFGLSRAYETNVDEKENLDIDNTQYVVTRWYRAPEVMGTRGDYNAAIDVWAVGCILAEFFTGKPLFRGDSSLEQLKIIVRALGVTDRDLDEVIIGAAMREELRSEERRMRNLERYLSRYASDSAVDLIARMLSFNPAERISVDDALSHPFFAHLYDDKIVNACVSPTQIAAEFESLPVTEDVMRDLMMLELAGFEEKAQPESKRSFWDALKSSR